MPVVSERELKYIVRMQDQTAREREAIRRGLGGIGDAANGVGSSLEKMAQAVVTSAAFGKIVNFAKSAVSAFADAEASAQRLGMALELRGMQGAEAGLNSLAEATQRLAGVDADMVRQLMAELVAQGKTEAQTRKLIQAATALSAVTGDDLQSSVEKLNGTLAGQARELGKNNLAIKDLTEEQLRNGDAIDIVIQQYGKFVGKTGETQIAMNVAKESVGDLVESIGETLAPAVQGGAAVIGMLAEALANAHPIVKAIVGVIVGGMIGAFAAMTVKTIALTAAKWGLFTSEMALNAAMAVTNPLIWAGIAAVGVAIGAAVSMASARQREAQATNESASALREYTVQARAASELAQNAINPFGSRTVGAFNPVNMQGVEELRKYIASLQAARQLNLATPTPMRQSGFGGPLTVDQAAVDRLAKELENIDAELSTAQSRMGELYTSGIDRLKSVVSSSSSEIDNLQRQLEEVKAIAANGQDQALKTQAIAIINAKIKAVLDKQAETASEAAENANSYLESLRGNLIRQKGDRIGILELERTAALVEMRKRLKDAEQVAQATNMIEEYYGNERTKIIEEQAIEATKKIKRAFLSDVVSQSSSGQDLQALAADPYAYIAMKLAEFVSQIENLMAVMNPINTMLKAMFDVLGPVINNILAPMAGIWKVLGYLLGVILLPILELMRPIIEAMAAAFLWFYNDVLVPVVNFIVVGLNKAYNAFVDFINSILESVDSIPFVDMSYRVARKDDMAGTLARLDMNGLAGAAGGSYGGSSSSISGSSASYAAGTNITIESIEIKADFIAGDQGMMDVAVKIRDLILEAEKVGR